VNQFSRPRIGEGSENAAQLFGKRLVASDEIDRAFETLEGFAMEAWSAKQVIQVLATRLALGVVDGAKYVVEVEVSPRSIVERISAIRRRKGCMKSCGDGHVEVTATPVAASS
jgi:hypothetical protein